MEYILTLKEYLKNSSRTYLGPQFSALSFFADATLLNGCFFLFHYLRISSFELAPHYFQVLAAFNSIWLFLVIVTRKFRVHNYRNFRSSMATVIKFSIYMTYTLSFMVIILKLFTFSRVQVFGTCVLYAFAQINWFSVHYLISGQKIQVSKLALPEGFRPWREFSFRRFVADALLLAAAFMALHFFKRDTLSLTDEYQQAFLIIAGIWFATSLYCGKFASRQYPNFVHAIAPYIKSIFLSVAVLSVVVFAFRLFFFSRAQMFGTFLLLGIAELLLHYLYSDLPVLKPQEEDVESVEKAREIMQQELLTPTATASKRKGKFIAVAHDIRSRYLAGRPALLEFLQAHMDFSAIDAAETVVLNTHTIYNVETIKDKSLTLFINLDRVNDIRRINQYFLEVHKKFYNGSYFVGRAQTISTHREKILSKYPRYFAEVMYALDFFVFRIMPKLPAVNKIYFALSKGQNRVLSEAEVLGRLYFCGFRVMATRKIDGDLYFIAQKVKNPSIDKNPSYGPIIKLKRVGYGGKIIYINKFRTMHPYSEYLQEYIYENFNLQSNGKFANDFRVTAWGKVFRRLWIDELPQLANFFRGDLALVGVRALSAHYFSLYPEDLRDLRTQFKPGIIPPYYADLPRSFEEIVESEKRYLHRKILRPFTTDLYYFFKAWYNIIFKKARSL